METLLQIHGELRWFVAIVAVIVLIKFAVGWLGKMPYSSLDRMLMSGLMILVDINLLLGLILLVGLGGGLSRERLEHAVTMVLAIVVIHLAARWRRSASDVVKFRNQFLTVLVALVLIFIAVTNLRGSWFF